MQISCGHQLDSGSTETNLNLLKSLHLHHYKLTFLWSECRDSEHYGVAAVEIGGKQVSTGHLHLDGSNLSSEKKKAERANALSAFLVRVSRFELEAS